MCFPVKQCENKPRHDRKAQEPCLRKRDIKNASWSHKDRVFRYAYYTLRNEVDAEDATQEVFIKLWNHFDDVNMLKVKSWLMRTTYNHCIDMIRKRQRTSDRHVEIQEYQNFDIETPHDEDPRQKIESNTLGETHRSSRRSTPGENPVGFSHV